MKFKNVIPPPIRISDIIFVVIFIIILFIPILKIDDAIFSDEDYKFLAKYKPLFIDKKLNFDYGKDLNNWFSERFNQRKKLIKIFNWMHYVLFKKNPKGFYDKENSEYILKYENEYFSMEKTKQYLDYLIKFNNLCKKNNIKLYVIITPQKTEIYPINKNPIYKNYSTRKFINYINSLTKENKLNIIYPYEELKEGSKENYVYYYIDYHLTDDGAFITYKKLMERIKKDFPDVNILSNNDYYYYYDYKIRIDENYPPPKHYGTMFNAFGIPYEELKYFDNKYYRYYVNKNINKLENEFIDLPRKRINNYHYQQGSNHKVILIGPSTTEALSWFIPYTFNNVKKIRINMVKDINDDDTYKFIKYYNDEIFDYHPEIIILAMPYFSLYQLENLFVKE